MRAVFVFLIALLLSVSPAFAQAHEDGEELEPRNALGTVRQVVPGDNPDERVVTVEITSGELAGQTVSITQQGAGPQGLELDVEIGERIVLAGVPLEDAADVDWQIVDYQRSRGMYVMFGLTLTLMIALGGLRGLKTIATLALTLGVITCVLLPLTLRGVSPLPLAVGLAALLALAVTVLTAGANRKAWAAVLGTTGAIVVSAVLASVFTRWTHLTGMVSEESLAAHAVGGAIIDFHGLLAASMLIGALGVILDLSLSIAAGVDELHGADPSVDRFTLFRSGWLIGCDLLSTTANTLLLAYLGGFLPVLLALAAQPPAWVRLPHLETVVGTAVTLMVGLLGLLAAVPLTAAAAARLASNVAPIHAD